MKLILLHPGVSLNDFIWLLCASVSFKATTHFDAFEPLLRLEAEYSVTISSFWVSESTCFWRKASLAAALSLKDFISSSFHFHHHSHHRYHPLNSHFLLLSLAFHFHCSFLFSIFLILVLIFSLPLFHHQFRYQSKKATYR